MFAGKVNDAQALVNKIKNWHPPCLPPSQWEKIHLGEEVLLKPVCSGQKILGNKTDSTHITPTLLAQETPTKLLDTGRVISSNHSPAQVLDQERKN